jgi:hypothetical protein
MTTCLVSVGNGELVMVAVDISVWEMGAVQLSKTGKRYLHYGR